MEKDLIVQNAMESNAKHVKLGIPDSMIAHRVERISHPRMHLFANVMKKGVKRYASRVRGNACVALVKNITYAYAMMKDTLANTMVAETQHAQDQQLSAFVEKNQRGAQNTNQRYQRGCVRRLKKENEKEFFLHSKSYFLRLVPSE